MQHGNVVYAKLNNDLYTLFVCGHMQFSGVGDKWRCAVKHHLHKARVSVAKGVDVVT